MKKIHLRLQTKIIILSTIFSMIVILILGIYSSYIVASTLERKIGENALSLAKSIALMPTIKDAFLLDDPSKVVQPLAEKIREEVGAEFIVIGNKDGIRYSHPYPDRLGKKMVGGDNDGVLKEGKAYISKATGTLGHSLRGKAPILDDEKKIIGVVSVGFLMEDIKEREINHVLRILGIVIVVLIIGILGSFYLSWNIKRDIFGLEPEEISQLFIERETILESVREGIIAVNKDGMVTVINDNAKKLIFRDQKQEELVGKKIDEVINNTKIPEVIQTGQGQYDQEMLIGDEWVITNRVPIIVKNKVIGAVASFRKKTEIDKLLQELSDHKLYSDTLRAQNHEFTNKLYTISGLLQLERYKEAIQFITDEAVQNDDMIEFLMTNVKSSKLTAFFIGKITRTEELKVKLCFSDNTIISSKLKLENDDLVTIYGNLIENAIDSVKEQEEKNRKIEVTLYDTKESLVFKVEDWGKGIPIEIRDQIYNDGFTTKEDKKRRGFGLALVNTLVKKYKGRIDIIDPNHQGIIFEVRIPRAILETGGT